jgi:hypothetical protein
MLLHHSQLEVYISTRLLMYLGLRVVVVVVVFTLFAYPRMSRNHLISLNANTFEITSSPNSDRRTAEATEATSQHHHLYHHLSRDREEEVTTS